MTTETVKHTSELARILEAAIEWVGEDKEVWQRQTDGGSPGSKDDKSVEVETAEEFITALRAAQVEADRIHKLFFLMYGAFRVSPVGHPFSPETWQQIESHALSHLEGK